MRHTCHAVGCDVPVPPRMLMCKRHWFMVPKPLRDAVWSTYRPIDKDGRSPNEPHLKNMQAAIDAVAAKEGYRVRSPDDTGGGG